MCSILVFLPWEGNCTEWWDLPLFCLQNNQPWRPNLAQTQNPSRSRRLSPRRRRVRRASQGRSQGLRSSARPWSSSRPQRLTAPPWRKRWAPRGPMPPCSPAAAAGIAQKTTSRMFTELLQGLIWSWSLSTGGNYEGSCALPLLGGGRWKFTLFKGFQWMTFHNLAW